VTEKHDLVHEFPEHRARIHALKTTDRHFARLFQEYHEVDHAVRRAEDLIDRLTDEQEQALKRRRLALKDALYDMLRAAEAVEAAA